MEIGFLIVTIQMGHPVDHQDICVPGLRLQATDLWPGLLITQPRTNMMTILSGENKLSPSKLPWGANHNCQSITWGANKWLTDMSFVVKSSALNDLACY